MTFLAALVSMQAPATAADFFPLTAGLRRTYEKKAEGKFNVIDETGPTAYFDGKPAVAIVQKDQFGKSLETTYYQIDGSTVLIVGFVDDRRKSTETLNQKVEKENQFVLLSLVPAMPVFKYDGGASQWSYTAIPKIVGRAGEAARESDPTEIVGSTKPGKERTVLGRKVETIEVRAEVTLGQGEFAQKILETSVYGRGIGLIESSYRSTANKKTQTITTRLIAIEEKREGR